MLNQNIRDFKNLEIWELGVGLVEKSYILTQNFPKNETFGLSSQIRRCSVSIPSNISEGFNRRTTNEFRHFLYLARGSGGELETQIEIARRLGFISDKLAEETTLEIYKLVKKITALINRITSKH